MEKLVISFFAFICFSTSYAQLGVNATGAAPIPSAQLDVASTTKALYPPRMTTAQKNAITGTQAGAVVFDTNLGALSYYNGGAWISTAPTVSGATYSIGQNAQGGKVFWVDDTGQHGLVMSLADVHSGIVWTNGYSTTKAYRNGAYGGITNTEFINSSLGNGSNATTQVTLFNGGNFGDWYLPSQQEMILMRNSGVSGIASGLYWTSNEFLVGEGILADKAYNFDIASGNSIPVDKLSLLKVRAVRKF